MKLLKREIVKKLKSDKLICKLAFLPFCKKKNISNPNKSFRIYTDITS